MYQKAWRNWIPHIATAIALVSFVGACLSYVWQSVSTQVANWTAVDRIQLAFLNSRNETAYLNSGDNDVVFLEEKLSCPDWKLSVGRGIFKRVPASDTVSFGGGTAARGYGIDAECLSGEKPKSTDEILFLDATNLKLKRLQEDFPKLQTRPGKGIVTYYSIRERKQKEYEYACVCIYVSRPK
jgi:hypothetical protein